VRSLLSTSFDCLPPRLIAFIFYFSLRSVVSSSSNSPCWILLKVFNKIQSVYLGHFYFHNTKLRKEPIYAYFLTVMSLFSAFVWAWRIATFVKAEVTLAKTKKTAHFSSNVFLRRRPNAEKRRDVIRVIKALTSLYDSRISQKNKF